jgi:hypothetical protein
VVNNWNGRLKGTREIEGDREIEGREIEGDILEWHGTIKGDMLLFGYLGKNL